MGDGRMDGYALQALLSKVSKWFQSGFKHLLGGPVNPLIWEVTFLQRKRKERILKIQGRGMEKERKRKGNGKEKERKRVNPRKGIKSRKEKEPRCTFRFYCKSVCRELIKGTHLKTNTEKNDEPNLFNDIVEGFS